MCVTCTSHVCHMHITSHVCHMHKYNAITCRSPAFANSTSILGSVAEKRRVCLDSGSRWRISRSCSEKPISNSLNVKWEHEPHYTHHAIPHTYSCMLVRKHTLVQTRTNANDPWASSLESRLQPIPGCISAVDLPWLHWKQFVCSRGIAYKTRLKDTERVVSNH